MKRTHITVNHLPLTCACPTLVEYLREEGVFTTPTDHTHSPSSNTSSLLYGLGTTVSCWTGLR